MLRGLPERTLNLVWSGRRGGLRGPRAKVRVWTAWPHPKDKGQQWPSFLLDWERKRSALPEPRGGKMQTRGGCQGSPV